jgi:hypothetical protein
MAKQTINIGTSANDGTGSTLRAAFDICNDNFTELYDGTGGLLHKIEGTNFTGSLLVGHSTTGTLSSAENNTGVGINSLKSLTSGDANIGLGGRTGFNLTTGSRNILVGYRAGENITTGSFNVAIGDEALFTEDEHGKSIALGYHALRAQDTGNDAFNIAIGHTAGQAITTGNRQVLIGGLAAVSTTTGARNIAIGYRSLNTNVDGFGATALGYEALLAQEPSGQQYTYNVAIGYEAGHDVSTGLNNTIIGGKAGDALTTGSNNTIIGYNAAASAVDVSNEVTIGNSSIANVRIPSDSTLKIGASGDLQLEHVSSNSFIKNTAVGDLYIENQVDDADIIFRSDDGSGGLATYMTIDGGAELNRFVKNVMWNDSVVAYFGGGFDLQIYHDGTNSVINNTTGHLQIYNNADNGDISFISDDGSGGTTEYFRLDGGIELNVVSKTMLFTDNVRADFGSSNDLRLQHSSGNNSSYIQNYTGDLYIENLADDKDIIFKSDDGSGGATTYFFLDGSSTQVKYDVNLKIHDSKKLILGDGDDLQIYHGGTDSVIENNAGDLYISNKADDKDIVFRSDDGSGGFTEYFRVDGSADKVIFSKGIRLIDNQRLDVGGSTDGRFYHDGTDTFLTTITGDLIIKNSNDDGDIKFKSDNGSGGETEYFRLDGGLATGGTVYTVFPDNSRATFGAGYDLQIYHDASNSYIKQGAGGHLIIQQETDDGDILLKCDDGSGGVTTYLRLDGSTKTIDIPDSIPLAFGSGDDLKIQHNGTDNFIDSYNGHLNIRNHNADKDIIFQADNGSGSLAEYFRLDGGLGYSVVSKTLNFIDNNPASFGGGGDLAIKHDGTDSTIINNTGDLYLRNLADDKDIIFQSDDGSGSFATYFQLDGSDGFSKAHKKIRFLDNVKASFGNVDDLEIYHDGSDSIIKDGGTGSLDIRSSHVHITSSAGGSNMAQFFSGGNSYIYANNVLRIEATTSGAKVYGDLEIENSSDGIILESPNGTRFRITVDNSGNLSTTSL